MSEVKLRRLSSVKSREVKWLWEPYFPREMLVLFEGDPDIGKTYCLMYFAAVITTGGELPDGESVESGEVVILSAEDDPAITLRPRIEAMGGDPDRVHFSAKPFTFTDECIAELDELLEDINPTAVFVDTLFSFMPDGVDTSKPSAVRQRLHAMDGLARRHGCCIIIVRHWTKGDRGKAIYRGGGLIDIVGVVRAGITVAIHPEDPKLRVFAHMKGNLSRKGESWIFEIVQVEGRTRPIVEWRGTTELTADNLEAAGNAAPKALETAMEFLRDQLSEESQSAKEMYKLAKGRGIAKRTVDRAKKELGVRSAKVDGGWVWTLPKSSRSGVDD